MPIQIVLPALARASAVVGGLALFAIGPVVAQGTSAQRSACTPDVIRLCSGDIPNVDRITACLKRERSRLSPGCRQAVNARPDVASTGSIGRSTE